MLTLATIWGTSYYNALQYNKPPQEKHWTLEQSTIPIEINMDMERSMEEHGEEVYENGEEEESPLIDLTDYKHTSCETKTYEGTFIPPPAIKELVTWLLGVLNGIVVLIVGTKRLLFGKVLA